MQFPHHLRFLPKKQERTLLLPQIQSYHVFFLVVAIYTGDHLYPWGTVLPLERGGDLWADNVYVLQNVGRGGHILSLPSGISGKET